MKVLAVGGGSGGHVTPVAAVLKQLYNLDPNLTARFVCDRAFEVQARGIMDRLPFTVSVSVIVAGKFRRYKHLTFLQHFTVPHVVFGNLRDSVRIIHGFIQSIGLLIRDRPDVVFAKGGYVCLPVGIAAWLLHIPLIIHDSDTRPGLTNRILARFATIIATGSPLENYPYDRQKSHYTGVPIDDNFLPVSREKQIELKHMIGVPPETFLLVATGGGLGSSVINSAVITATKQLAREDVAAYIVAGRRDFSRAKEEGRGESSIRVVDFVYDGMADILGAADVVIARGSATFLQEIAGLEKAAVVIPARQLGDQIKNAEFYKSHEMAVVLTDDQLQSGELVAVIRDLRENDAKRRSLAKRLHSVARPHAASDVAQLITGAVKKP